MLTEFSYDRWNVRRVRICALPATPVTALTPPNFTRGRITRDLFKCLQTCVTIIDSTTVKHSGPQHSHVARIGGAVSVRNLRRIFGIRWIAKTMFGHLLVHDSQLRRSSVPDR